NDLAATQALKEGESVEQSYTVRVRSEERRVGKEWRTITLHGNKEEKVITNTAAALVGSVTEAGNADDGTVVGGTATVSGQLSASDVDAGATQTWTIEGTSSTTSGSVSIDSAKFKCMHMLANDLAATQALKEGESVEQSYTVRV